jgi:outer membrane protein assembly factor BamE
MLSVALSGCTLYRCNLQQGNYITQAALDKLEPGLTKNEVQDIMGSTVVNPMFVTEEWNYSYGYVDGKHRDQPIKFHTITLNFKNGRLTSYNSNYWHPANLPREK